MLLSARILENVSSVNGFDYADTALLMEGDTPTIYFQLIDLAKDPSNRGFVPAGRRYMPAAGATLQATLDNLDLARKVVKAAAQPFPLDPSIWSVTVTTTDKIRGTVNLVLQLTEGAKVTRGVLPGAVSVYPLDGMTRI